MTKFSTKMLSEKPDVIAPDGSNVRILISLDRGSMAHFEILPGETSIAVAHRTIEEIWYFLTGKGEMWRKQEKQEEIVTVQAGVCLTIPAGTHFQFRSSGDEPLSAIGITMPPWPGEDEAYEVDGKWSATLKSQK